MYVSLQREHVEGQVSHLRNRNIPKHRPGLWKSNVEPSMSDFHFDVGPSSSTLLFCGNNTMEMSSKCETEICFVLEVLLTTNKKSSCMMVQDALALIIGS